MIDSALPPQDRGAEFDLLAAMIGRQDIIADVRDQVTEEDFYFNSHRLVFSAIVRRYDCRRPTDAAGIDEELVHSGQFADVGPDLLGELAGSTGSRVLYEAYVERVLSKSLMRGLNYAATETLRDTASPTGPGEELLERAQQRLDRLAQRVSGTSAVAVADAVNEALSEIDARMRGDRPAGLRTGFVDLDGALCGGLPIGQLTILAARPSIGKTALSLAVTREVCRRGGTVLFLSLEQPRRELTERLLSAEAGVNGKRIREGRLSTDDVHQLGVAADRLRDWHLLINDYPAQTAGQMAAGARRTKRKAKSLDLIVVDYLSLVSPDNPRANRNEQTAVSCRRIREMARELGVPALLLCQLNRGAADDEVPRLHHLRDSGEIEQVADVVLFLHRAAARVVGKPDRIELHIAKQRNGPLDLVTFEYQAEVFTFREAAADIPN